VPPPLTWNLGLPGLVAIVAGVLVWIANGSVPRWTGVMLVVGGAAAMVVTSIRSDAHDRRTAQEQERLRYIASDDLDDRKLDAATQLFDALGEEIGGHASLIVDFRRVDQTPPMRNKTKGPRHKQTILLDHHQAWLEVQANLLDGTALSVTATLDSRRITRHKEALKTSIKRRGRVSKLKRKVDFEQTLVERLVLDFVPPVDKRALLKDGVQRLKALGGPRIRVEPIKHGVRVGIDVASGTIKGPPERGEGAERFLDGRLLMRHLVVAHRALFGAAQPEEATPGA
jgi:hypothetical protein